MTNMRHHVPAANRAEEEDGKTHLYWSLVENKRLGLRRVWQRHVLHLGEINSSQAEVWRKAIDVFDADARHFRTLALFPEDRCRGRGGRCLGGAAANFRKMLPCIVR